MIAALKKSWRRSVAALGLVLALAGGATAQTLPGITNQQRAQLAGLVADIDGPLTLLHSPSVAQITADEYRKELISALAWYRDHAGWPGRATIAILDKADFGRITAIPYPTPHAESMTGFIIIADDIHEHPGFDLWDLDATAVNLAWSFHEIGHVIAADLGIRAGSAWVNELIANVFMAGYIRAERPALMAYQSGMPPRFANAGVYTKLSDLDRVYFEMGQLNYLWFHFQMAKLSDLMVENADFATVLAGLKREFPAETGRRPISIAETFARLEWITPGITASAGALAQ